MTFGQQWGNSIISDSICREKKGSSEKAAEEALRKN